MTDQNHATPTPQESLLTADDLAKELKCGLKFIHEKSRRGEIPFVVIGLGGRRQHRRYSKEAVISALSAKGGDK